MDTGMTAGTGASDTGLSARGVTALEPIPKRKTIRNQVVRQITDLIISGALPAGTRLTELGVAQMLGVSRVPVREAFLILQGDQWIDIQESQGAKVHVPRPNEVKDIFEIRMSLESDAAALSAQRHNTECEELFALAQAGKTAMMENDSIDRKTVSDLNERFHNQIAHLSGNLILAKIIELMNKKTQMYFTVNITTPRGLGAWDEHLAIVDAIAAGNHQEASALMRTHILESWRHFEQMN